MKLSTVLKSFGVAMMLACCGSAFAQLVDGDIPRIGDGHRDHDRNSECRYLSHDPQQCDYTPGCQFSRIFNECIPSNDGPIQPIPGGQCSRYDNDARSCSRAGCEFDRYTGQCSEGDHHEPPFGGSCSRYDNNGYQCEQAGCGYNQYTGECRDHSGGPIQPPSHRGFVCTAVDNGWEEHWGGHKGHGRSLREAERNALRDCQRYHICRITECNPL